MAKLLETDRTMGGSDMPAWKCSVCGYDENTENARFCGNCGRRFKKEKHHDRASSDTQPWLTSPRCTVYTIHAEQFTGTCSPCWSCGHKLDCEFYYGCVIPANDRAALAYDAPESGADH